MFAELKVQRWHSGTTVSYVECIVLNWQKKSSQFLEICLTAAKLMYSKLLQISIHYTVITPNDKWHSISAEQVK